MYKFIGINDKNIIVCDNIEHNVSIGDFVFISNGKYYIKGKITHIEHHIVTQIDKKGLLKDEVWVYVNAEYLQ